MTIIIIGATILVAEWLGVLIGLLVYRIKQNGRDLTESEELNVYGLILATIIFCVFVGVLLA